MSKGTFKVFKTLARLLLGLMVLTLSVILILPVAAYFFFDPNDYRPQIAHFISQKTDLPLAINGKIDFQLFPWFGLKVQKLELLPPNSKERFIQIEEIGFQIPIKELVRSHFQIESLSIKGMQINLTKYANGTANWEYLSQKMNKTPVEKTSSSTQINTPAQKKLHFNITGFAVENATLYYQDQQENQLLVLENLHIQGNHEKETLYPIKGKFELVLQKTQEKKPTLKGSGEFTGKALLASKTLMANLQTQFTGQAALLGQQVIHLSSHMDINPSSAIIFKNVDLKAGPTQVKGRFNIPVDSQAPLTFNMAINKLNLDQMHFAQTEQIPSTAAHNIGSKQVKTSTKSQPFKKAAGRTLSGDVQVAHITVKNVILTDVKSHVRKEASMLKLDKIQAALYQGSLTGTLSKNLENALSSTYFQGKITGTQLRPLLNDLKGFNKITGTAAVNFNMSYHPRSGFNGTTQFQIKQGVFQGVDVNYYLASAHSFLKKEPITTPDNKMTPFDILSGTLNFHENIIHNPDLQVTSNDFIGSGEGSINLNTQAIAYKLKATRQYHDNKEHPNAYPLALRIRGTIEHPIVEPDLDLYLKEALKREATKQVNKQLEKRLGKILGIDKDAEKHSQEDAANPDPSSKDKLQEKIEKEVGKGLKKILGF